MNMQELKEKINKSGWTLKEIAAALDCTPQHLSAVLCGRARLTDKFKSRIEKVLQEIQFSNPVQISVSFTSAEWQCLKEGLPEDIDIQETIRDYLWWLWMRFYVEKMPKKQREKFIKEETEAGYPPADAPLYIHRLRKAGEARKLVNVLPPQE